MYDGKQIRPFHPLPFKHSALLIARGSCDNMQSFLDYFKEAFVFLGKSDNYTLIFYHQATEFRL